MVTALINQKKSIDFNDVNKSQSCSGKFEVGRIAESCTVKPPNIWEARTLLWAQYEISLIISVM